MGVMLLYASFQFNALLSYEMNVDRNKSAQERSCWFAETVLIVVVLQKMRVGVVEIDLTSLTMYTRSVLKFE